MYKIFRPLIVSVVVFTAVAFFSSNSYAIPAFARQVGVSCSACHFQHFPELNAFGRAFKAAGYTQAGGSSSLIEDENLSLPTVINAAFVTKFRYVKDNSTSDDPTYTSNPGRGTGVINFPDEASIFLAGRAGDHIGFLTEWGAGGVANFRMPVVFEAGEGYVSVIPFTSDALGAQSSFELLNTGAVGNLRAFEDGVQAMSAQRYIGTTDAGTGQAEGVALVYASSLGFVNATLWTPQHGGDAVVKSWSHYLRAAVTPTVGSWDLGLGVQYWGGTSETDGPATTLSDSGLYKADTKAYGVDAQAMGMVGNMPLGIFVSYGKAEGSSATGTQNLFNSSTLGDDVNGVAPGDPGYITTYNATSDKTATSISAELGVLPSKVTIGLGYRISKTGAVSNNNENAVIAAVIYKLAQNIQIGLSQAYVNGDATEASTDAGVTTKPATSQTMLNVFAAF